ncbi:hypothetical protein [Marinomonas balearica]|uniref:Uncharacterized protein n=1 Tax=Marinomonas balearica TaxID=491947 RepID=A0A4R6M5W7_9GAMM|nr:hypothetical protein [Marinomonas balearica]TDO96751.1 hypothetical protein DFP79_2519 [Marinomonas balearica]
MSRTVAIYMLLIPLLLTICSSVKAFESEFDSGIASASAAAFAVDLNKDSPQPDIDLISVIATVAPRDIAIHAGLSGIDFAFDSSYYYAFSVRAPPQA